MMGWNNVKTVLPVLDHIPLERNPKQPTREAYNPFASHSPNAVAAIACGGVTTDAQTCKFDRSNKPITPISAKRHHNSKHLGRRRKRKRTRLF